MSGGYWMNCDGCGRLLFSSDRCGCSAEDVRYVVVSTSEDVSLRVDSSAYVIDLDGLADDEREILSDSDSFGWYGPEAAAVVSRVGVAMSEVLDAFAIVRRLVAAGLMGQVLDALAAEEAPGFRLCGDCSRDRAAEDDEWTDCNDDGGAVCNAAAGFPCSACAAARGVEA